MTQQEIYYDLKKIVEPIHAHCEQLIAIAKYVEEKINGKERKPLKKPIVSWSDAEIKKPYAGQEIIFIDAVGMYKGVFHPIRNGVVYIEGKKFDTIEWETVYEWIQYPINL